MSNKRSWTENQKKAIYADNGSIIVSAAAGSGKTAVLVERVINEITSEKKPTDIDRLLIVTYTKAAANEMKQRISVALSDMLNKKPFDKNLRRQVMLMPNANISTIHGFCSKLLKDNFQKLNISPEFKILQENEATLFKAQAMEKTLEKFYNSQNKEFLLLSEMLSNDRDDKAFADTVETLYNFVRSYPFDRKWYNEKLKFYDKKADNFMNIILEYAEKVTDYLIFLTDKNLNSIQENSDFRVAYHDALIDDMQWLSDIKLAISDRNWDLAKNTITDFQSNFKRFKSLRGYNDDNLKEDISNTRKKMKDIVKKDLMNLFLCTKSEYYEDLNKAYPIVKTLFDVTEEFSKEYFSVKQEKNYLDFSDLEHLSLELLTTYNSEGFAITSEAKEISDSFDEIMIDEYQDINEVQDTIFKAISKDENNIFAVGDVKQSIYRFRQAMPEIFMSKKNSAPFYDPTQKDSHYFSKIILEKNFRSRSEILNACNFIFKLIMSKSVGEIAYNTKEEMLFEGLPSKSKELKPVEVKAIDLQSCIDKENEDKNSIEARYIANLIKQKLAEDNTLDYRDFCILLRSLKGHTSVFEKVFKELGIPLQVKNDTSFFEQSEILTVLSLLRVIDNPVQDIPLLSILLCPIYGFSIDEIAQIRMPNNEVPIYNMLLEYSHNEGNLGRKCTNFIDSINYFSYLSVTMPVHKFIKQLCEETGYYCILKANKLSDEKTSNIEILIEYAKRISENNTNGLSGFIKIVDTIIQKGGNIETNNACNPNVNAVKLMSMHASKGLEFPVCIVAGTSRKFNTMDMSKIKLNMNAGIGIDITENSELGIYHYKTLMSKAINIINLSEQISEEIRVLYVALTRAKEKLVIVGAVDNVEKKVNSLSIGIDENETINPYFVSKQNSFFDWILSCMLKHSAGNALRKLTALSSNVIASNSNDFSVEVVKSVEISNSEQTKSCNTVQLEQDNKLLNLIEKRFNFDYSLKSLHKLTSKITVSELSFDDSDKHSLDIEPDFRFNNRTNQADKGTIIHKYLAFVDFNKAHSNPQESIEMLLQNGVLTREESKMIDLTQLEEFYKSNLFERISKSDEVYREYRFTVRIDANELDSTIDIAEQVLLQGSVDCIFAENENLVIIDYKTGRNVQNSIDNDYKKQIMCYKVAVEKCFNKKVSQCLVYSFSECKTYSL